MLDNYESPTFLGRKNKLLMGMTFTQVAVFMASLIFWVLMALAVGSGMLASIASFGPLHALTVVFLSFKIHGIAVPAYLSLMGKGLVVTPLHHSGEVEARNGIREWQREAIQDGHLQTGGFQPTVDIPQGGLARLAYRFRNMRKRTVRRARSEAATEARAVLSVEVERHGAAAVNEGKDWLRVAWRMIRP